MACVRGADPLVSEVGALGKHLALIGFMGAGKSTIGREVAERTARPFVDTDAEIERLHGPIPELFERGEPEFRRLEEQIVAEALAGPPSVIALGGGAVLSEKTRERLRAHAYTVLVDVDVDEAWERVKGSNRPLARREEDFRELFAARRPVYTEAMDAPADDAESVALAALRIFVGTAILAPESYVVVDERVLGLHPLEGRDRVLTVPPGEEAKSLAVVERIWRELELDRDGMLIACGGGSTTDVAGFAAATYKRGVKWTAIPTTLTGMVDAAIGGKTGINTGEGKNLAGVFHFPQVVFIDTRFLATLPDAERRAGMAEVVKTGLLAGREVWKLARGRDDPRVRRIQGGRRPLRSVRARGPADDPESRPHVRARARNRLRLHGLPRRCGRPRPPRGATPFRPRYRCGRGDLAPEPVAADPDAAWASLKRDKKGEGVFVLLEAPGKPVVTTLPDAAAREALEALIRK